MSAFEELGICPEIIQAVEEDDWLLPTPVQQEAVPLILGGGDVLVAAETGSGKTGAFGLPCLQIVHETLRGKCSTRKANASNLKCELNLNDKDMFVLVTEDGMECKSEDDKRWNGTGHPASEQKTHNLCMTTFNKYLDNPTVRITLFVGGIDEKAPVLRTCCFRGVKGHSD
eukprot:Skav219658  [mRNA]  locus=scaffold1257:13914:27889:+ [translate_table: standard]